MAYWRWAICSLMVLGCGKNDGDSAGGPVGPNTSRGSFPLVVEATAKLPVCEAANERQLIYVQEDKEFRHCFGGEWLAIDLRGAPGPKGEPGQNGEVGVSGEPGAKGMNLGYIVADATGQKIGYPDTMAINVGSKQQHYLMFLDGYIGQMRFDFGEVLPGNLVCHYETNDCQGSCFALVSPQQPDGNHLMRAANPVGLFAMAAAAKDEGSWQYHSRSDASGECEGIAGYGSRKFLATEWQHQGMALPFALPLKVVLTSR